jgi:hypothetical protein
MGQYRGSNFGRKGNMRHQRTGRKGVWVLVLAAVVLLGASCSKAAETTSSSSTTLVVVVPRVINGWSAKQLSSPAGANNSLLAGVSCLSGDSCTAVGAYEKNSQFFSLIEHWNGSTWSTERGAPAGASATRLLAVSCPSTNACFAVGDVTKTGSQTALVERWNGATWSVESVELPKRINASDLTAISCYSPVACTAVGSYRIPPLGKSEVLIERWNGLRWALQVAPALSAHLTSATLLAVSCPTANACFAVGQTTMSSGSSTLADYWNGFSWATQPLPVAPGHGKLAGVSCVSPTDCTAVGDATDTAGHDVSLAEHWDGLHWYVEPTAVIANRILALSAVSCPTAATCTAVGRETIAVYSASRWSVQQAPVPTTSVVSDLSGPSAVACVASGACTAVGVSFSQAGVASMLVASKA